METRLLVTLEDYQQQLETHLSNLRERHRQLDLAWMRLREIYEGEGAEIFAQAVGAASARLAEYSEHGTTIASVLRAKVEELRHFEAG